MTKNRPPWGVAELADAPDCFSGGEPRKCSMEVRILPLQPTYYMDVGDLVMQALLSVLIGAMVYLWFLSSCIIPAGTSVFEIDVNTIEQIDYNIEELPR